MMKETERLLRENASLRSSFLHEEKICDFFVDETRKKIWLVELDLLLKIDQICKKHGLRYFLFFGSLLGAVRHHGFIPWDDDLDICMFREDYEKFLGLAHEFSDPYFLQIPQTDPGYYYSHAKVRNSNTSAIDKAFVYQHFNMGIFVDVLPIDAIALPHYSERFRLIEKMNIDSTTFMKAKNPRLNDRDRQRVASYDGSDPLERFENIQKTAQLDNSLDTDYCTLFCATLYGEKRTLFKKQDFAAQFFVDFCGFYFPIPSGWDSILTTIYGDYMKLPPLEDRGGWHGNVVFYPDVPYRVYFDTFFSKGGSAK